jgi:hypothetical protein
VLDAVNWYLKTPHHPKRKNHGSFSENGTTAMAQAAVRKALVFD